MGRNYEVYAIVKPDLSEEYSAFINYIIKENMLMCDIKRDKDTFYHKNNRGARDLVPCVKFYCMLDRYREYFELLDYNSYFEGAINVTDEIAGSEYNKLREIRWFPISEKYPDASVEVLVTVKLEDGGYRTDICEYSEECGFGELHEKVIAWAKLPLPYI